MLNAGKVVGGVLVLLAVCLPLGSTSSSAAAQPRDAVRHPISVVTDGGDNGLSSAVRAQAALKARIALKYREMAVISDDQYRITQTAIRDNHAHQTPLHTSEMLFSKCMHDGRYSEASIIASLAVLDSNTPVERAHFTLLQAEACLLRQDDMRAIRPLLQQAADELAHAGTHDDAWQQAEAMLEDMQAGLL
mgnify:FL=1